MTTKRELLEQIDQLRTDIANERGRNAVLEAELETRPARKLGCRPTCPCQLHGEPVG